MKILYVTNMYPVRDYIYYGIHVKEQIECLRNNHNIKDIVYFIDGRKSKFNYLLSIFKANYLIYKAKIDYTLEGRFNEAGGFGDSKTVIFTSKGPTDFSSKSLYQYHADAFGQLLILETVYRKDAGFASCFYIQDENANK